MGINIMDRIGEFNPQIFREFKGKLTIRNVGIVAGISVLGQLLIYFYYSGKLPNVHHTYSRYCMGEESYRTYECVKDVLGNWPINWGLFWLDIFICMSIMGIFAILVVGTHMLIADLSKEESRGTLNFIRISPQSSLSILGGKMLGVPILLYLFGLLALPFHLGAGLAAHIPLILILSFYGVLGASCIFFYSLALLYGLVSFRAGGFQAWLGSGGLFFSLLFIAGTTFDGWNVPWENPADWLRMFYPGTILPYLVNSTWIDAETINYLGLAGVVDLRWYELSFWNNPGLGIGFILLNLSICIYGVWQGLKRRFPNQTANVLSKKESYFFSASLMIITQGFALQNTSYSALFDNFVWLFLFQLTLCLLLVAALTPQRQILHDWARFRHQKEGRNLVKDLILGEKSPAIVAIALNLIITSLMMLPALLLLPLGDYKIPALLGLVFNVSMVLIYATIAQLFLLLKKSKGGIGASITVLVMMLVPLGMLGLFGISPGEMAGVWLFSLVPVIATYHAGVNTILLSLLGQWTVIILGTLQMSKTLRKVGESESKALLSVID